MNKWHMLVLDGQDYVSEKTIERVRLFFSVKYRWLAGCQIIFMCLESYYFHSGSFRIRTTWKLLQTSKSVADKVDSNLYECRTKFSVK